MNKLTKAVAISMTIWFLIYFIILKYSPEWATLKASVKPDDSPPWYFIIQDLNTGISSVIGLVISLIGLFIFHKKIGPLSIFLVYITFLFYGPHIGDTIVILKNTSEVFDPALAISEWKSYQEYFNNAWRSYVYYLYLFVITLSYIYFLRKKQRS